MTQDRAVRPNPGRGLARVWRRLMAAVSNAIIADGERATRLRRARLAGVIGVIGHPLYFVIWSYVFPQPYESVWLRGLCTLLFVPLLFVDRVAGCKWLPAYAAFAVTVGLPFAFVFLYLQNAGAMVWAESLLIAVVILFHFSTAFAVFSWSRALRPRWRCSC